MTIWHHYDPSTSRSRCGVPVERGNVMPELNHVTCEACLEAFRNEEGRHAATFALSGSRISVDDEATAPCRWCDGMDRRYGERHSEHCPFGDADPIAVLLDRIERLERQIEYMQRTEDEL